MTKVAVNPIVVLAQTNLNVLSVIVEHQYVFDNLTDNERMNEIFARSQLEAIYCRCVDVFHDTLYKLVLNVAQVADLSDNRLWNRLSAGEASKIKAQGSTRKALIDYLKSTVAFKVGRLRKYARELGFPINDAIEVIVLSRNCIVHNGTEVSETLRKTIDRVPVGTLIPALNESCIVMDRQYCTRAIDVLKRFLENAELHLEREYGVGFSILEAREIQKVGFSEWYKSDEM